MRHRNTQLASPIRHGLAATELAMWLPFLSLMFVIAIDFCRVFYASQTIQNCACAGAMYAGNVSWASADDAATQNPAITAALAEGVSLRPPLQTSNVSVVGAGTQTQVTVTYVFPLLVHWPGYDSIIITRSVTVAIVPQPAL